MLVAGAFPQVQVCVSAYVCLGERSMIIKIIINKITIIITIRNSQHTIGTSLDALDVRDIFYSRLKVVV